MVSVQVQRCRIYQEFDGEQQHQYFGISRDKSLHHIDTLYYAVFLNEVEDILDRQDRDDLPGNLKQFIEHLREHKEWLKSSLGSTVEWGNGLESVSKSFSLYEFCVSLNECFDIFISSYLPTAETPRVVVQLRSRYLVLEGVKKAVEKSFDYLKKLLSPFGLLPVKVRENRIDYAFHTNLIQNPYKFFRDEELKKHLKTNLRIYQKIGKIGSDITVDTFNLGNRKSNNVFFRAYNKAREVIELNYKSFFFDRWLQNQLISQFDYYVYQVAYELKSYRTGILVGRMKWYVEYGTDSKLKQELLDLIEKCFVKSDNCEAIEKKVHGVIPEPTMIVNIEFQTKRKFYTTCDEYLNMFVPCSDIIPQCCGVDPNLLVSYEADPSMFRLYTILDNAREFIDYLTGYGNVVSFVKDNSLSMKDFLEQGEPYQNWWNRIRHTPIEYSSDSVLELYRTYDQKASIRRTKRLLEGQVARLSILKNSDTKDRSFQEDLADALCVLNDNDVSMFVLNPEYSGQKEPFDYRTEIRPRKARQLRGIVERGAIEREERPGAETGRKEEKE